MEKKHQINSIYLATEGEGIFVGRPQIFVRYQGCNIGCLNCDSKDTWDFKAGSSLDLKEVLDRIQLQGHNGLIKAVSITGGDPLHPSHVPAVYELIGALKEKKYYINIEASGSRVENKIFDLVDFISFDFKTLSTGVETKVKNIELLNIQYPHKFQIKSVIFDQKDFEQTLNAYRALCLSQEKLNFTWVLTPCYNLGEEFPLKRFQEILKLNESAGGPFRVIGQQHKWVFGPDKKEV